MAWVWTTLKILTVVQFSIVGQNWSLVKKTLVITGPERTRIGLIWTDRWRYLFAWGFLYENLFYFESKTQILFCIVFPSFKMQPRFKTVNHFSRWSVTGEQKCHLWRGQRSTSSFSLKIILSLMSSLNKLIYLTLYTPLHRILLKIIVLTSPWPFISQFQACKVKIKISVDLIIEQIISKFWDTRTIKKSPSGAIIPVFRVRHGLWHGKTKIRDVPR